MRFFFTAVLVSACWNFFAQTASEPLTFEVASVKPSAPNVAGMFLQPLPGGNLRMTGATLKNLIAFAYNVREFSISDGPDWASYDRFDIDARVGNPAGTAQQIRERLKALLAERFQLLTHTESKEQSVYVLVVAKNGPVLREAKPDASPMIRKQGTTITGAGIGMAMLVLNLANSVNRPVLDKTGLTGKYDFKLEWSPDALTGSSSIPAAGRDGLIAPEPDRPLTVFRLAGTTGAAARSRESHGGNIRHRSRCPTLTELSGV